MAEHTDDRMRALQELLDLGQTCGTLPRDVEAATELLMQHLRDESTGLAQDPASLTPDQTAYYSGVATLRHSLRSTPADPAEALAQDGPTLGEVFDNSLVQHVLHNLGGLMDALERARVSPSNVEVGAPIATDTQLEMVHRLIVPLMVLAGVEAVQITPQVPDYIRNTVVDVPLDDEELRMAWIRYVLALHHGAA